MKRKIFLFKKWAARTLLMAGAVLGIASCRTVQRPNPAEAVYGPPPDYIQRKVMIDSEGHPVVVDPVASDTVVNVKK
ncbi:MAG: hypothetical protein J6X70_02300 [Muribaculaceae bacterium]|nr:hypothetical protein [Muribaculaceae bacterium]